MSSRWSANHDWLLYNQGDGPTKLFPPGSTTVFDACISEALATLNVGKESKHMKAEVFNAAADSRLTDENRDSLLVCTVRICPGLRTQSSMVVHRVPCLDQQ